MKVDVSKYRILLKRLTGTTLKIFFCNLESERPVMVLVLKNIVAFINQGKNESYKACILEIGKTGIYGADISMRLKRPEINNFDEVLLFADEALINCNFRALAEFVEWREFDNDPNGDVNY